MNLVNKQVLHKVFGKGIIVNYNDLYVDIDFSEGSAKSKKFIFPDAFDAYLTLLDQKTANKVNKILQKRKKEDEKEKQRLKAEKALQKERRRRFLEQERLAKKHRGAKIHPCSQSVFWCKQPELNQVFTEWNVFTGLIKSGAKQGQPKRLPRISGNSACLITTRDANMQEKDRRIQGMFMVNENFNAKTAKDGYIPAHTKYKFRLSEQESKKMLFWNYYINENYPHRITWKTGRHRYFDNVWMANILQDVLSLQKQPRERELMERFLKHFCQVNRIKKEGLPPPGGALKQIL